MEAGNRKRELIEAAMQIVAENGLSSFTMKKATIRAGVSEALIYKYFPTKEDLLYSCYETVHKQVAALYSQAPIPVLQNDSDLQQIVHSMWMSYFDFLISNDYRTIFYFDYRDSQHIRQIMMKNERAKETYFANFAAIFAVFNSKFHIYEKSSPMHLWNYIMDTSGLFAKRIIRGELPDTPESRENVWRLIAGGIWGLFASSNS